jgi:Flp pilus assembly protein TadG
MSRVKQGFFKSESGAAAVYVAIGLVILVGCGALALDIAHMVTVKSQLQKAADAGSMAGARALWPMVQPVVGPTTINPDCAAAFLAAQVTTLRNQVDGSTLAPDGEISIQVGLWDYGTRTFTRAAPPIPTRPVSPAATAW